jgi:hypothetical protein
MGNLIPKYLPSTDEFDEGFEMFFVFNLRTAQFPGFAETLDGEADADAGPEEFIPGGAGYARPNVDERGLEGGEGFRQVHCGDRIAVGILPAVEGDVFAALA